MDEEKRSEKNGVTCLSYKIIKNPNHGNTPKHRWNIKKKNKKQSHYSHFVLSAFLSKTCKKSCPEYVALINKRKKINKRLKVPKIKFEKGK